jgi:hypothetical protein
MTDGPSKAPPLDSEMKRSILLSARIRTAPAAALARERTYDEIVERHLSGFGESGLEAADLHEITAAGGQKLRLAPPEVNAALGRLVASERVLCTQTGRAARYRVGPAAKGRLEALARESEAQLDSIVTSLFGEFGDPATFRPAFLSVVCRVFGELGDLYVRGLSQVGPTGGLSGHQLLSAAVGDAAAGLPASECEPFRIGVIRFFRDSTPSFDALKWTLAQNHYLLRLLGLDPAASLLSRDLFQGRSLVLDTNVLVAALSPRGRHFKSLGVLGEALRTLGVELVVLGPTAREFRALLARASAELAQTYNRIPGALIPKVRGFLLEAFLAAKEDSPDLDLGDFLRTMEAPFVRLESVLDIKHLDDGWFEREEDSEKTRQLAGALSKAYLATGGRPKQPAAATHDALLLRWLARSEAQTGRQRQLLTLDRSLLDARPLGMGGMRTQVVSLDALLQWAGSVDLGSRDGDDLAGLYAQTVAFELFPKSEVLSLADFRVFADMEIEAAQLPAEDVEACIAAVRQMGPSCGRWDLVVTSRNPKIESESKPRYSATSAIQVGSTRRNWSPSERAKPKFEADSRRLRARRWLRRLRPSGGQENSSRLDRWSQSRRPSQPRRVRPSETRSHALRTLRRSSGISTPRNSKGGRPC